MYISMGQYKAGLAGRLLLNEGAPPTLRGIPAEQGHVSISFVDYGELVCVVAVFCL